MSEQTPDPGQPGHPQVPYPQAPYPQAPYPQAPYAQNPYGQAPYGQAPYGYAPTAPDHPQAVTAFVLGMVAGPGSLLTCGLALLVAPFAWYFGARARKEIRLSQGRYGGQGKATTGYVIGIIATILLVLVIGAVVALITWAYSDPAGFDNYFSVDDGTTV